MCRALCDILQIHYLQPNWVARQSPSIFSNDQSTPRLNLSFFIGLLCFPRKWIWYFLFYRIGLLFSEMDLILILPSLEKRFSQTRANLQLKTTTDSVRWVITLSLPSLFSYNSLRFLPSIHAHAASLLYNQWHSRYKLSLIPLFFVLPSLHVS